ncbi:hypothetical protein BCAR13_100070 [Paraburkholderia caribensis]|nr:hypothetical protein BCAR13_100070 [Paraburkholderia caribensis]
MSARCERVCLTRVDAAAAMKDLVRNTGKRHDTHGDPVTAATVSRPSQGWSTARYGLLING